MDVDAVRHGRSPSAAPRAVLVTIAVVVVAGLASLSSVSPAWAKASATSSQTIRTVAGDGAQVGPIVNGGSSTSVALGSPVGIAADAHGNVVIADQNNNDLRVAAAVTGNFYGVSMTAGHIYTIVGNGSAGDLGDGTAEPLNGPAVELDDPNGVALDPQGDIVITNTGDDAIRFVAAVPGTRYGILNMQAGHIYTIAGGGEEGQVTDGGQAVSAGMTAPDGVAFDPYGNVVVSDTLNDLLRVVPQFSGTYFGQAMQAGGIYTIAGINAVYGYTGNGGPATSAEISVEPYDGLAVDAHGDVAFPDADNNVVRLVAGSNGTRFGQAVRTGDIYTIAGTGKPGFVVGKKNDALKSQLDTPQGVAFDSAGDLLVSDSFNNTVRLLADANGSYSGMAVKAGRIYTIAGTRATGYSGDGGPASAATLNSPAGLSVAPSGGILVADNGNNVVRELSGVPAVPTVRAVKPTSGLTSGDRRVTITGSNLEEATSVWFGSHQATSFSVVSARKVVAYSPLATPGTVAIVVTTPEGQSVNQSGDRFTFVTGSTHGARADHARAAHARGGRHRRHLSPPG